MDIKSERIGVRQEEILLRGRRSMLSFVMPGGRAEKRAILRLEKRGMLKPALGWPDVWELTPLGRRAWLKVQR